MTTRNTSRSTPQQPRSASDDTATRTWLSVVQAYHHCSEVLARRLADAGVRTAEHEILLNLRREPGLSQQTLAARCFTAKSHISGVLTELEGRGWVRREPDPRDARAKRLYLEPAGARVADQTAAIQAEVVALMTRGFRKAELEHLQSTMHEVSARLQQALATPSSQR